MVVVHVNEYMSIYEIARDAWLPKLFIVTKRDKSGKDKIRVWNDEMMESMEMKCYGNLYNLEPI